MLTAERFAGGTDSVDRIGLGDMAACRALRSVGFDHPFAALSKESGEHDTTPARIRVTRHAIGDNHHARSDRKD